MPNVSLAQIKDAIHGNARSMSQFAELLAEFLAKHAAPEDRLEKCDKREINWPNWKPEIRRRLAKLKLGPAREAALVEEIAQHLEDCYAKLLVTARRASKVCPFGEPAHSRKRASADESSQSIASCGNGWSKYLSSQMKR